MQIVIDPAEIRFLLSSDFVGDADEIHFQPTAFGRG